MDAALTALFSQAHQVVFVAMGVFARIGAAAFLVPGLGERSISIRVRLGGALAIAFLLAPMIQPLVPEAPATPRRTVVSRTGGWVGIGRVLL